MDDILILVADLEVVKQCVLRRVFSNLFKGRMRKQTLIGICWRGSSISMLLLLGSMVATLASMLDIVLKNATLCFIIERGLRWLELGWDYTLQKRLITSYAHFRHLGVHKAHIKNGTELQTNNE